MKLFSSLLPVFFLFPTLGHAAGEKPSEFSRVTDFLKDHVVGHTLKTTAPVKTSVKMEAKEYFVEYSRRVRFSDLKLTKTGLVFDMATEVEYVFPKKGEIKPDEKEKRKITFRFELSERKSTGDVMGFIRITKDSFDESTGEAFTLTAEMDAEGNLVLKDTALLFVDQSVDGGKTIFPGSTASTMTFKVDPKSKALSFDQAFIIFEVDPNTFARVPLNGPDGKAMSAIHVPSEEI